MTFVSDQKNATASIVLVVNALVWYLLAFSFLKNTATNSGYGIDAIIILVGLNLSSVILASLSISLLMQRIGKRLTFLNYWMFAGIFLPLVLIFNNTLSFVELVAVSLAFGIYFGFGLPFFTSYFAATTKNENRAKISGIIFLLIGVSFISLNLLISNNILNSPIALVIWRIIGLLAFLILKPEEKLVLSNDKMSYKTILSDKSFLLYFVPWWMFSLVNNFAFSFLNNIQLFPEGFVQTSSMLENILAGISALFVGFFADRIGRKKVTLFGFTLLGLGYASLGLFSKSYLNIGLWFYAFADGIAWGAFTTIFLLTLWGDLANKQNSEKYYVLGFIPYLISNFMQLTIGQYVTSTIQDEIAVFSYASFFLFVAVLPLFVAPETLPEKAMKDRDLKSYLDKAQKYVQKENEKSDKEAKKKKREEPQKSKEETDDSPEFIEAKKLAEKYY